MLLRIFVLTLFFAFTAPNPLSATTVTGGQYDSLQLNGLYVARTIFTVSGPVPAFLPNYGHVGPGIVVPIEINRLLQVTFDFSAPGSVTPEQTLSSSSAINFAQLGANFSYSQPGTYQVSYSYHADFYGFLASARIVFDDGSSVPAGGLDYQLIATRTDTGVGSFEVVIPPVPELSTCFMLIIGFASLGAASRRLRRPHRVIVS